jgi:thymidylate kinase
VIIAVEGVDCSGKGKTCKALTAALGAVLYKTPPENMKEEQERINATTSDIEHYRYFIGVVQRASEDILAMPHRRNVVIDRYWMTTVVYHRAMGIPATLEEMGTIMLPDFTVYLGVSPEVQAVRMTGRGMSEGDKRMQHRQQLLREIYDEVLATQPGVIRVDTSNLPTEKVVAMILSSLPPAITS